MRKTDTTAKEVRVPKLLPEGVQSGFFKKLVGITAGIRPEAQSTVRKLSKAKEIKKVVTMASSCFLVCVELTTVKNKMTRETTVPVWPGSSSASRRLGVRRNEDRIQARPRVIRGRPTGLLVTRTCFSIMKVVTHKMREIPAAKMRRACLLNS